MATRLTRRRHPRDKGGPVLSPTGRCYFNASRFGAAGTLCSSGCVVARGSAEGDDAFHDLAGQAFTAMAALGLGPFLFSPLQPASPLPCSSVMKRTMLSPAAAASPATVTAEGINQPMRIRAAAGSRVAVRVWGSGSTCSRRRRATAAHRRDRADRADAVRGCGRARVCPRPTGR